MTAATSYYQLNQRSLDLCRELPHLAGMLRIGRFPNLSASDSPFGCWDFGIRTPGGLAAGLLMARTCLAGQAKVQLLNADSSLGPWPLVSVHTDHPLAACMASQYAGWKLALPGFFAMGSGPMRAAAGKEALFKTIGHRETPDGVVGVCETGQIPTQEVIAHIAQACHVPEERVLLLFAPTRSLAGTIQVVARSIETALHQMHERGWDLTSVQSAHGSAPLPPVAANDLIGIGRTNDAILYGARVTLWMVGDDHAMAELVTRITSSASPDYGRPFAEIFQKYNRDFYQVDPQLFAPAEIHIINLSTGHSFTHGQRAPDILAQSFAG